MWRTSSTCLPNSSIVWHLRYAVQNMGEKCLQRVLNPGLHFLRFSRSKKRFLAILDIIFNSELTFSILRSNWMILEIHRFLGFKFVDFKILVFRPWKIEMQSVAKNIIFESIFLIHLKHIHTFLPSKDNLLNQENFFIHLIRIQNLNLAFHSLCKFGIFEY